MDNRNNKGKNKKFYNKNIFYMVAIALLVIFFISRANNQLQKSNNIEISYNEFLDMIEEDKVEKVILKSDRIEIYPQVEGQDKEEEGGQNLGQIQVDKFFTKKYYTGYINDPDLANRLIKAEVHDFRGEVPEVSNGILEFIIVWVIPFAIFYLVIYLLFRNISKSGTRS